MENTTVIIYNDEPTVQDGLKRQQYAQAFARLAETCKTPLVVGLYGTWGMGKTSLMKLIQNELDESKTRVIWFNLWEHQFSENPVVALAQVLTATIGGSQKRAAKKLLTLIAVAFGARVLQVTTGLKILELLQLGKIYEDERFQTREAQLCLREHFKALVEYTKNDQGKSKRLVFFIDDLDRCMPDEALKLLEALKLYLNIEGCIYFLGVDGHALEQSVKRRYEHLDLKETDYLDKIVQLPFIIPPIEPRCMDSFIQPLLSGELHSCRKMLVDGLGDNPRHIKRFINILTFNHQLACALKIPGYDPRVLALLLLIQLITPVLYREITYKPDLLLDLKQETAENQALFAKYEERGIRVQNALKNVKLRGLDAQKIQHYLYLTRVSFAQKVVIDLGPIESVEAPLLKDRYVLWVDDRGLGGAEGIEQELRKLGAHIVITENTEEAEQKIRERTPDILVSDIARGNNYNAGLEMAEKFKESGLFGGPYYFYAGDLGHGRIGRASKIGATIFTEPKSLLNELKEVLAMRRRG